MIRRPVAVVTAIVLFLEGLGIAGLQWFLGSVVDRQQMSLAGLDPDAMSVSTKAGGVVFGLYFVFCGVVSLLVALRNRPAAGLGRILLISVAVVNGLLGALTVGPAGWGAFAFMMVVLGLVLLTLMTYDRQNGVAGGGDDAVPPGGSGGPESASVVPPAPSTS